MSDERLLRSTSTMAMGTLLSRATGFLRQIVLVAAIGQAVFADTFTVAKTLPNIVYLLLVGGTINAVFVPQLVKRLRTDDDSGAAYTDRLLTLVSTALLVITVLAVLAAPWIVALFAPAFDADATEVAVAFARFCLPQIFLYGLFTMWSQVLNARGLYGAPMYAPAVNNVVAIASCLLFLAVAGTGVTEETVTDGEIALLGLGSTLGTVAQALVLLPVLRAVGYRWRPRFDWRGAGLSTAGRLAAWTVVSVCASQVAYLVVNRLATTANVEATADGSYGAGITVYATANLFFVLPHAIITVSLATALLTRMSHDAHEGDLDGVRSDVSRGLRFVGAAMIPAAVVMVVLGPRIGVIFFSFGSNDVRDAEYLGIVLALFAVGLPAYSAAYILTRAFFALEDTRTPALLTIVMATVNVGLAWAVAQVLPPEEVVAGLALAYSLAYMVMLVMLVVAVRPRIGGIDGAVVLRTHVRLLVAAFTAGLAALALLVLTSGLDLRPVAGALFDVVTAGTLALVVFLAMARVMHIDEVTDVVDAVRARLRR